MLAIVIYIILTKVCYLMGGRLKLEQELARPFEIWYENYKLLFESSKVNMRLTSLVRFFEEMDFEESNPNFFHGIKDRIRARDLYHYQTINRSMIMGTTLRHKTNGLAKNLIHFTVDTNTSCLSHDFRKLTFIMSLFPNGSLLKTKYMPFIIDVKGTICFELYRDLFDDMHNLMSTEDIANLRIISEISREKIIERNGRLRVNDRFLFSQIIVDYLLIKQHPITYYHPGNVVGMLWQAVIRFYEFEIQRPSKILCDLLTNIVKAYENFYVFSDRSFEYRQKRLYKLMTDNLIRYRMSCFYRTFELSNDIERQLRAKLVNFWLDYYLDTSVI